MPRSPFDPCIPTKAAKVPDRPEWIHEIKHDGYRLTPWRAPLAVSDQARSQPFSIWGKWCCCASCNSEMPSATSACDAP